VKNAVDLVDAEIFGKCEKWWNEERMTATIPMKGLCAGREWD
jgi:hypothetical protein